MSDAGTSAVWPPAVDATDTWWVEVLPSWVLVVWLFTVSTTLAARPRVRRTRLRVEAARGATQWASPPPGRSASGAYILWLVDTAVFIVACHLLA
jgi:hypothetical protein